jgi:transcription elongation factor/antiterminator RfaH
MGKQSPAYFFLEPWRSRRETLMLSGGERWYLVQSLPRREPNAEFQLNAQKFRAFLPSFTKTIRHARKLRTVRAPVFSGYLFVILDLGRDQWRSINGTFGVARIVTFEDRPSPVPPGLVEAMLDRTDAEGETHLTGSLSPGQSVRILAGPFAQLVGTLDRLDAGGRVRVLLEIMGGTVSALLMRDALEPATQEPALIRSPSTVGARHSARA